MDQRYNASPYSYASPAVNSNNSQESHWHHQQYASPGTAGSSWQQQHHASPGVYNNSGQGPYRQHNQFRHTSNLDVTDSNTRMQPPYSYLRELGLGFNAQRPVSDHYLGPYGFNNDNQNQAGPVSYRPNEWNTFGIASRQQYTNSFHANQLYDISNYGNNTSAVDNVVSKAPHYNKFMIKQEQEEADLSCSGNVFGRTPIENFIPNGLKMECESDVAHVINSQLPRQQGWSTHQSGHVADNLVNRPHVPATHHSRHVAYNVLSSQLPRPQGWVNNESGHTTHNVVYSQWPRPQTSVTHQSEHVAYTVSLSQRPVPQGSSTHQSRHNNINRNDNIVDEQPPMAQASVNHEDRHDADDANNVATKLKTPVCKVVKKSKIPCHLCQDVFFIDNENLLCHQKENHPERGNRCTVCTVGFHTKQQLWTHLGVHVQENLKRFKTQTRSEHDESDDVMTSNGDHKDSVGEEVNNMGEGNASDLKCDKCRQEFSTRKELEGHKPCEHIQLHKCSICHVVFFERSSLKAHTSTHFKCDECGKRLQSKYRLDYHMKTHLDNDLVECDRCGKHYRDHRLEEHKLFCGTGRKKKEKPKHAICHMCGLGFSSVEMLTNHLCREHGETSSTRYQCDQCEKFFYAKCLLSSHVRIHTNANRYKCDCGRKFRRLANLVTHRRKHTGERPFKCMVCDKRFTSKERLSSHRKVHAVARKYWCDLCDWTFVRRMSYVYHRRLHTGERPFQCKFCGKRFVESSSLGRHQRQKHKKELKMILRPVLRRIDEHVS